MDHADFAALLPSEQRRHIDAAVAAFPFPARLISFTHGCGRHTYAALEITRTNLPDESATFLVCPQNLASYPTGQPSQPRVFRSSVYLGEGRYRMTEREAVSDMYDRANR